MRAVVIGATGVVGQALLQELSKDPAWTSVMAHARRKGPGFPKVQWVGIDEVVRPADAAFCCLGTTIRKAGSQDAFRAVDHGLVVRFAKECRIALVRGLHVVSALGADPGAAAFYNRVKGEMERDVAALRLPRVCVYRPSLLLADRDEARPAERAGVVAMRALDRVMPRKWKGIPPDVVARAMARHAKEQDRQGFEVHASEDLWALAGEP
jgi:uncharacterized protein YbjT (DUF2867 family)